MITEALLHCPGIGPRRLAQLHDLGIRSWSDVLDQQDTLPQTLRSALVAESHRCLDALHAGEISYFTTCFAPQDKWRILAHFLDQASYFDIETVGLEHDAPITVISCWHGGRLHNFVEHENLDAFLELLDEIQLLVSFNGSSFDVPRVLDTFHVPQLPCAHLDLRWTCFHQGMTGGLKEICGRAGIVRPPDLHTADGELAVRLWSAWRSFQDTAARELLIRYCASDVLMLVMLARRQSGCADMACDELWKELPAASEKPLVFQEIAAGVGQDVETVAARPAEGSFGAAFENLFGQGSPQRLRARRTRSVG